MSVEKPPVTSRGQRKVRIGVVVSNKMQKTIVVQVSRLSRHGRYGRVLKQATSFKVHDENNQAVIGDWVKIMETRPISKDKRWRLVEILRHTTAAMQELVEEADFLQPKASEQSTSLSDSSDSSSVGAASSNPTQDSEQG